MAASFIACFLIIAGPVDIARASEDIDLISPAVVCESCKAVVYEAEAHIGKQKRTGGLVAEALENICSEEHMRYFEAQIPAILMMGCRKVLDLYDEDEGDKSESLDTLIRENPAPDGYKYICNKACLNVKDGLAEPAEKQDPSGKPKKKKKAPVLAQTDKDKEQKDYMANINQQISFGGPENALSDEEELSTAMPDNAVLRCDACSIIMQTFASALLHSESLRKRPLSESQRDATLEHVCKAALGDYGVYTNIKDAEGVKTTRYMVPGQWKAGPDTPVLMQAHGGKWTTRLTTACHSIIEQTGEEDFYKLFHKHVPAPARNDVHVDGTFEGAEAFMRATCVEKEVEAEKKTKKTKKKKKSQSTQDVRHSCSADRFHFNLEGWKDVVGKGRKEVGKIEL